MKISALLLIMSVAFSATAEAKIERSRAEVRKFKLSTACPVNGLKRRSPCPGHEVDHIIPLCAGGADKVENMQWLAIDVHQNKTKIDVKHCAILRKAAKSREASN